MRLCGLKYGSARILCLGLFLVYASGVGLTQESSEVKEVASRSEIVAAAPEANEGTM